MINKRDTEWGCCICGKATTELHEIFFGHGNRPIAVKHHIQVPVCVDIPGSHHDKAHGRAKYNEKSQEMWKRVFCDWLGISYIRCLQSFNGLDSKNYLFEVMTQCKKKIDNAVSI